MTYTGIFAVGESLIIDTEALEARGPIANEKTLASLRERVALIEQIVGLENKIWER